MATCLHFIGVLVLMIALQARAQDTRLFGYVGVECGLDAVRTPDVIEDGYISEATAFSNLNMVCVSEDPGVNAPRFKRLAAVGDTVLLNVQPALFDFTPRK